VHGWGWVRCREGLVRRPIEFVRIRRQCTSISPYISFSLPISHSYEPNSGRDFHPFPFPIPSLHIPHSSMAAALGAVVRRLHTAAAQPPRLTKFALHPPKSVSLRFPDDQRLLLLLRRSCLPQVLPDSCGSLLLVWWILDVV
jgi:hypothetical protein